MGVKFRKVETNDCYSFLRQLMHAVKVGSEVILCYAEPVLSLVSISVNFRLLFC